MIFSIIEQGLIALPLVLGGYLTLSLLKVPDFSIESAYLFGAAAAYLAQDLPFPYILLSAFFGGGLIGSIVCSLNQIMKLPYLLAAIVVNGFFHGFTQYCLGTSVASVRFHLPIPEFAFLAICSALILGTVGLIFRSQLGYSLSIFGNNPHFFSSHLMSGRYVLFFGVILGHGCAGISGFLFIQSSGFIDLTMNFGVILLCLMAIMIGKLFRQSVRPNLVVPLIGVFGFFTLQQALLRLGLNLQYFNAFQAIAILSILTFGKRKRTVFSDLLGV